MIGKYTTNIIYWKTISNTLGSSIFGWLLNLSRTQIVSNFCWDVNLIIWICFSKNENFRCQLLLVGLCYYYQVRSLLPLEPFKANNWPLDPLKSFFLLFFFYVLERKDVKLLLLVLLILYTVQGLCSLLELEI